MEIERDVDWRSRAACGPDNAEWFWLVSGCGPTKFSADNRAALALCGGCPVRQQCYADAVQHPEPFLRIAGGLVIKGRSRASIDDIEPVSRGPMLMREATRC
jgi:hypothetical protein